MAGIRVVKAFHIMNSLSKGRGLSFAFQMVQNFQDESCFILSTLKGKAPLLFILFN